MHLLLYLVLAPVILLLVIFAFAGNWSSFSWKRYGTALVIMCLATLGIYKIILLTGEAFFAGSPALPGWSLVAIFIFTLLLSVWFTKHIRGK